MRLRLIPALAVLLSVVACSRQQGTYILSEVGETDLGVIKEKDGVRNFHLVALNDSRDTLYPVRTYTRCSCVSVRHALRPVAPGEMESVELRINPAYRGGLFMEEIQVYYSNQDVPMRSFVIKGEIRPCKHPIEEDRPYDMGGGLYMSHKNLPFGQMAPGQTKEMFFRYGNGGRKKAEIGFTVPPEWCPYLKIRQPGVLAPDRRDTLHVSFTMPDSVDSVEFAIVPTVGGRNSGETITVTAARRK